MVRTVVADTSSYRIEYFGHVESYQTQLFFFFFVDVPIVIAMRARLTQTVPSYLNSRGECAVKARLQCKLITESVPHIQIYAGIQVASACVLAWHPRPRRKLRRRLRVNGFLHTDLLDYG